MNQNIALPDYPEAVKEIAIEVLETLTASIHWMKMPKDARQREIMVRRWAGGIAESHLSHEGVRKAVVAYLNGRWAKDPIPEPNDVFGLSDEKLDEFNGGGGNSSQMRLIRRYLTIAHNWRSSKTVPAGGYEDECGCSYLGRDSLAWQHTSAGRQDAPEHLPELLEAMGHPDLAEINRLYGRQD